MTAKSMRFMTLAAGLSVLVVAGCGQYVREQGRGPTQVVILGFEGASGAKPDEFGATLNSDVVTLVKQTVSNQEVQVPTIYNDLGRVVMTLILKDPGQPGVTTVPTPINQVTFTRYRVSYKRADGRNTPGVDVPYAFDSGATFTVPAEGNVTANFELVRHIAKEEAPLKTLGSNGVLLNTIADVTFYGRDQAGNEVTATGSIGIVFGNFGDPQ